MSVRSTHPADAGRNWRRREFLTKALAALAATSLLTPDRLVAGSPLLTPSLSLSANPSIPSPSAAAGPALQTPSIRQVIDALLADIPGAPFPQTVDTIKSGNPDQPVKGIVTTMFATEAIIEKAIALGVNFIIAHEPTFYNHTDETDWLGDDPVLRHKKDLLDKHKMVVWRCHDGIHAHKPDLIRMGVLADLNWQDAYTEGNPVLSLPEAFPLERLINFMKHLLGIQHLKYIGDPAQLCKNIIISPGASGGRSQIGLIQKYEPDIYVCGELNEWETSEYIRDARYQGRKTALVVLGHSVSEEPGMELLAALLRQKFPNLSVTHLPSGDPFAWA